MRPFYWYGPRRPYEDVSCDWILPSVPADTSLRVTSIVVVAMWATSAKSATSAATRFLPREVSAFTSPLSSHLLSSAHRRLRTGINSSRFHGGTLHHEWVVGGKVLSSSEPVETTAAGSGGGRTVLFLHGLLGSGKNLRGPAKRLTQSDPTLSALLLDLRGHGTTSSKSTLGCPSRLGRPHTLEACALDVVRTLTGLGLVGEGGSPVGVVGHSFGGRVAMQYVHALTSAGSSHAVRPPQSAWILDSVPGRAHGSVADVIGAVSSVPVPIRSKKALVEELTERGGVDKSIAMWMTTNLVKSECGGGFEFAFDLNVASDVLEDFPRQDFFSILRDINKVGLMATGRGERPFSVNMVMAGKNTAWTDEIVSELERLGHVEGGGVVAAHVLENAGHWVHVDNLDGLMRLMEGAFK